MRIAALLLAACGGADAIEASEWIAADFVPPDGMELELIPPESPDAVPVLLRVSSDSWELREGTSWDDAAPIETLAVEIRGGALYVADGLVLPAGLSVGADGVVALGERETWYGTFARAVTVELADGPLAGEAAFAEGIGPVYLTWDGEPLDLATYRPE